MIFLSAGNNDLSFIRLFLRFEKIFYDLNKKNVEVICQIGHTEYKNKNFKIIKFLEKKKFNELIKKSTMFVSHAGAGSVIDSIQNQKIPILLPRKKILKEHIDDHQVELYEKLLQKNLASPIEQMYNFKNKKFSKIKKKNKIYF
jgi:UDP-N-acetylglucosamine transferase subunit ALG13